MSKIKSGDRVTLTAHGRDEWSMINDRLTEGTVVDGPFPDGTLYIDVKWDGFEPVQEWPGEVWGSLPHTHDEIKKVTA